jgi:hypothetical protein
VKWRIKTRGWKNSGSQRSSLSPLLSLVRIFPAENQNPGFEKAGGSEQESICFLFFPPGFWGKPNKKNKSAKVAIFTEFVLGEAGFYEISIFPSRL